MFWELIILIIIFFIYFHIYMMFKINKNNEIYEFNNVLSKQNITNEIAYKYPFYFNIDHIIQNNPNGKIIENHKNYNIYNQNYEAINILEPFVKFYDNNIKIEFKKKNKNLSLESFLYYRNYYMVHEGKIKVTLIHPKYKENFIKNNKLITNKENIKFIKGNSQFKHVVLEKNQCIFIPNYWIVFVENLEEPNTIVELIQYKSILNELCFIKEKYLSYI